jgi:hypothetical protein
LRRVSGERDLDPFLGVVCTQKEVSWVP